MASSECAAVRAQLSAYLDGEMDDAASQTLLAHLNECADCTTFFNTLRKTLTLYRALAQDPPDAEMRMRLLRALELEQK